MRKLALSIVAVVCIAAVSSFYVLTSSYSSASPQLKGYDPVSYFVENAPVAGQSAIAASFDGDTYFFASEDNKKAFLDDPEKFIPQYDGHCSYGVSLGQKFDIDPLAYRIVDGRLFLQLDPGTRKLWMEAEAENIRVADKNWPQLQASTE